jgi:hypothetical protein
MGHLTLIKGKRNSNSYFETLKARDNFECPILHGCRIELKKHFVRI